MRSISYDLFIFLHLHLGEVKQVKLRVLLCMNEIKKTRYLSS